MSHCSVSPSTLPGLVPRPNSQLQSGDQIPNSNYLSAPRLHDPAGCPEKPQSSLTGTTNSKLLSLALKQATVLFGERGRSGEVREGFQGYRGKTNKQANKQRAWSQPDLVLSPTPSITSRVALGKLLNFCALHYTKVVVVLTLNL